MMKLQRRTMTGSVIMRWRMGAARVSYGRGLPVEARGGEEMMNAQTFFMKAWYEGKNNICYRLATLEDWCPFYYPA